MLVDDEEWRNVDISFQFRDLISLKFKPNGERFLEIRDRYEVPSSLSRCGSSINRPAYPAMLIRVSGARI